MNRISGTIFANKYRQELTHDRMKGATPIRARRPDAAGIRAASHDSASLAGRPIRATRSKTLLNHRPLTTPVPLHARWGLSRLSSHQSRTVVSVQWYCVCTDVVVDREFLNVARERQRL